MGPTRVARKHMANEHVVCLLVGVVLYYGSWLAYANKERHPMAPIRAGNDCKTNRNSRLFLTVVLRSATTVDSDGRGSQGAQSIESRY
eukprot:5397639-Amphidinium_carterae.2